MSKEVVIRVENLGKKYHLGSIGTGTLQQDLNQWWSKLRGREDPFARVDIDETMRLDNGEFWALKDLNFEVNQGDILGIIGNNGAGKSTLLKILSRVTTPTLGEIKVKGRIASLLEVGTGFHPELTGRENIFLNGAILGMTKLEIKEKLDEIIDFSGVERHIDTPVKRYSSGMYVRLAFAVAAHLDTEILIMDEVLAVGDAEFQKKCIGRMSQVASQGRTILFVSHSMSSVQTLCSRGIILNRGSIVFNGATHDAVSHFLIKDRIIDTTNENCKINLSNHPNKQFDKRFGLQKAEIFVNNKSSTKISPGDNLYVRLFYNLKTPWFNPVLGIVIKSPQEEPLIGVNNLHTSEKLDGKKLHGIILITIPNFPIFGDDQCNVDLYFGDNEDNFDFIKNAFFLDLIPKKLNDSGLPLNSSLNRVYLPKITFANEST